MIGIIAGPSPRIGLRIGNKQKLSLFPRFTNEYLFAKISNRHSPSCIIKIFQIKMICTHNGLWQKMFQLNDREIRRYIRYKMKFTAFLIQNLYLFLIWKLVCRVPYYYYYVEINHLSSSVVLVLVSGC